MQTSWRAYGGINRQDRSEDINVNILSANYFTLRNSYQGLFGVSGDVVVTGDVTGEANLGVRGSVDVSNCVDISNNLWVHNFAHVHQELYLGDSSGETGLPYLYGLGWDSSASIGINNSAPLAALDISGSNSQSLHVYTSSQTSRNIIARNVNAHGIVSSASDGSSALIFYNTTPIPSLTDASGDAAILYTASGDLTFSAPHSVNIWSKAIVDPKYTGVHILEETLVVGDVSCGVYEPSLFRNADFSTGRALSLVSDNSWSNTVLSVITPGALGAALVGGAYPLDTARSMASMGVYAAPGGSGAVFVPAAAAVLGASAVRRRVCLGVNTGAPRVDEYVMHVNGPALITNCEVVPVLDVSFEILGVSHARQSKLKIVAVGSPIKLDQSSAPYAFQFAHSEDGGASWSAGTTADFTTAIYNYNLKSVAVYDALFAAAGGESGLKFVSADGGATWTTLLGVSISTDITAVGMFAQTNPSYYVSGQSTVLLAFAHGDTLTYLQLDSGSSLGFIIDSLNGTLPGVDSSNCTVPYSFVTPLTSINALDAFDGEYVWAVGAGGVAQLALNVYSALSSTPAYEFAYIDGADSILSLNFVYNAGVTYNAVAQLQGSRFAIFAGQSTISYTTDGTTLVDSDVTALMDVTPNINFTRVDIFDASRALIFGSNLADYGSNPKLYYTSDGAVTWAPVGADVLDANGYATDLLFSQRRCAGLVMTSIDSFMLANVYDVFASVSGGFQNGYSKMYHCYVPDLFTHADNDVLDMCGNMRISGNTSVYDNLFVSKDIVGWQDGSLNANLRVGLDASVNGYVFVGEDLRVLGDSSLNSRLFVGMDASCNANVFTGGALRVVGDASLNSRLFVGLDASCNANVFTGGALRVVGDASLNSRLCVGLDTSCNANVFTGGALRVVGDASLNSRLFVGLDASCNANVFTGGALRVVGDASLNSRLFVGLDTSCNANVFTGGALRVVGDASLNSRLFVGLDASCNANVFVKSGLRVVGDASLNANLTVGYDASVNRAFFVGANATVALDASVNGNIAAGANVWCNYVDSHVAENTLYIGSATNTISIGSRASGSVATKTIRISDNNSGLASTVSVGTLGDQILLTGNVLVSGSLGCAPSRIQMLSGVSGTNISQFSGMYFTDNGNADAGFMAVSYGRTGMVFKAPGGTNVLNPMGNLVLGTDVYTGLAITNGIVTCRAATGEVGNTTGYAATHEFVSANIDVTDVFIRNNALSTLSPWLQVVSSNVTIQQTLRVSNSTDCTGVGSGALQISGGVSVGANVAVGGNLAVTGAASVAGIVSVSNTGVSASTASGALVVTGGVGVGGALYIGGSTRLVATTVSTSTASGALVVSGGVGVAGALWVGDTFSVTGAASVGGSAAVAGALAVTGALTATGAASLVGVVTISNTTPSTSTASGAIVVSGGAGVGGALWIGGAAAVAGVTSVSNTSVTTSTATGALIVSGGAGVGGALYVGGNVRLQSTTPATSTATGALVVSGGAGISGNLWMGGALSVGGNSDIAGVATVNKISERVAAVASVSNVVGVDYTASAALYYVTGSVTGNLVCNITNVPTSATYRTYTVSVVIPAKYCVSSATVNGAAVTLLTNGGILNNNISNATLVIQQISVMMTSVAATPTHVVSSIGAYY